MTLKQAKKIALAAYLPHTMYGSVASLAAVAGLHEQMSLDILRDIMHGIERNMPGAVVSRVQDTFIIDTVSPLPVERVKISVTVTEGGVRAAMDAL